MTVLKITIEDEQAGLLRTLLKDLPYIKKVEEEPGWPIHEATNTTVLKNIKKILEDAKGKNLFNDIDDPVKWQREIREEWERDI